jgi:hypothetical protein
MRRPETVTALYRLQYPDEGHVTVCARAAVATAIVTMNATAAVRRGAVMPDSRSPGLGPSFPTQPMTPAVMADPRQKTRTVNDGPVAL